MSRILFLLLILVASFQSYGQLKKIKFGDVSIEDLTMEVYPLDSGAEAVYLISKAEAFLDESDGSMVLDMFYRIKILKESGLKRADIELQFVRGENEIQKLKAATYNAVDGKKVTRSVSRKEWVTEKFDNDVRSKKLSFPEVKVGSVIEYSYRQKIGSIVRLPSWSFQTSIPTVYSEYKMNRPKYGTYLPRVKGYEPLAYKNAEGNLYHAVMMDVPALKREPYISTLGNYRSTVEFELKSLTLPGRPTEHFSSNWKKINKELYDSEGVGKAIRNTGQLRRVYPTDKGWGNNMESLIEIYNYIRDHFEWNGRVAYRVVDRSKDVYKRQGKNPP